MRCVSIKRLVETFKISTDAARQIRGLCEAVDDRDKFENYVADFFPEHFRWESHNSYYRKVDRVEVLMQLCNKILGTYGVESHSYNGKTIATYCNTGDNYAATLMQNVNADNLYIGCWATMAEAGKAN